MKKMHYNDDGKQIDQVDPGFTSNPRMDLVSLHIEGYEPGPQKTSKEKANEREQGQEEFEKMLYFI